jgi:hypothetical protein
VIPADDLDGAAVAAIARVGDGDAVLGIADLAETGKLDLDSHGGAISPVIATFAIQATRAGCPVRFCLTCVTAAQP